MPYAPLFEMWRVTYEDEPFDIVLDLGHVEHYPLTEQPWFFGVRIPMVDRLEDGTASETEARRLDAVENRIREVVRRRDGLYVGRRTGSCNRDLLFYFAQRPNGLEDRIRASIGMEILFISRADRRWEGYEQLLPTDRELRQIEDRKLINALVNEDADPALMHVIEHCVETPIKKGADALAKLFLKLQLEDIEIEGSRGAFLVRGMQQAVLEDVEKITRVSFILETKSPKARGTYIGWTSDPVESDYVEDEEMPAEVEAILKALGDLDG